MDRNSHAAAAFGVEVFKKITGAKLLVVGAGGIGCELLKNLVMTGFQDIEVIDLDTIDVSNLNRQFLFRPEHVSQSKARVARDAVTRFNPASKVVAHHGNIKSAEYGVEYFRQFDLVMNALDNVSARRHVNRLCLAAGIPLVESGTAGYVGQTYVIKKGVTRCFDCVPAADTKTYPICTIRSTPEKPVHCVVWAKELYKLLFSDPKTSMMYEDNFDDSVYMKHIGLPEASASPAEIEAYAERVFTLMFRDEIQFRLEMKADSYKTAKFKPVPLELSQLLAGLVDHATTGDAAPMLLSQKVLTGSESAHLFLDAVKRFCSPPRRSLVGGCEFSKDDDLDLDFVTAATNLRALVFTIPLQSRFDVKSIAGNIIPAIATTNAIVAGLQVLQAVKLLQNPDVMASCRFVYCNRSPSGRSKSLLLPVTLDSPSSSCYVCGTSVICCAVDTTSFTLHEFVDQVLKGRLGFNTPSIALENGSVVFEETGDEEEDEYFKPFLPKPLNATAAGGIHNGTLLLVVDFSQDLKVHLSIVQRAAAEFEEKKSATMFEIVSGSMDPKPAASPAAVEAPATAPTVTKKRSREEFDAPSTTALAVDADDCEMLE